MKELPNDIDALKAKIKSLLEQIQHLEAENAELRRRLELDSSNSHIQHLEAENAELRRRLELDSSNSHIQRLEAENAELRRRLELDSSNSHIQRLEAENAELRRRLELDSSHIQRLEAENAELRRRLELDSSNSHIQRLEAENAELRRRLELDSSNSHIQRLEAENAELRRRLELDSSHIQRLEAENAELRRRLELDSSNSHIQRLEAENAELRRRLGQDSSNSHKPPSSDGYAKPTLKPGIPKDQHPKGGQKGHQGKTLERVANPDRLEIHLPGQCQCCGRPITAEEKYEVIGSRQVFDLPSPKLEVIEHQIGQIECCGTKQHGEYPINVTASVQYGENVKALIAKLSIDHRMPLGQISQLFEDTYGYQLNSTTIEATLKLCYELAEPIEQQVKERLLEADTVHFDETGIRAGGKLHWLHTASTENYTHLFIHEKRGQEALNSDKSVLKDYKGRAIHDCWAPYFKFEGAKHALCGAHLLRELDGLKENGSQWACQMQTLLLELHKTPPAANTQAQVRDQYHRILSQADLEEPKPEPRKRGKAKQSVGRNLYDRFQKYEDEVLAFAFEAGVPFTNNQAERDLRSSKVKQKVCGGFRTKSGAEVYARLQATTSTFRKQGLNVFATLRDLFLGRLVVLA